MTSNALMRNVITTKDPVELCIAKEVNDLRSRLDRLLSYVEKSGARAKLKDYKLWKPYDFFHYFCTLYQEKYRKEYKVTGSIVRAYQRIEEFKEVNNISNEEYITFMEIAFNQYFNLNKQAVIGSICSYKLFNYLMNDNKKHIERSDWMGLDAQIKLENKKFLRYIEEDDANQMVNSALEKENEKFSAHE